MRIGSKTRGSGPQRRMEPRGLSCRRAVARGHGEGIVRHSEPYPIGRTSDTKIIGGVQLRLLTVTQSRDVAYLGAGVFNGQGGRFARAVHAGRFEYVQRGETTLHRETIDAAVATLITTAEPTPDCIGPGYDLSALHAALGCYRRSIRDSINKRGPTVVGPIRQATSESLQLRDTGYEL